MENENTYQKNLPSRSILNEIHNICPSNFISPDILINKINSKNNSNKEDNHLVKQDEQFQNTLDSPMLTSSPATITHGSFCNLRMLGAITPNNSNSVNIPHNGFEARTPKSNTPFDSRNNGFENAFTPKTNIMHLSRTPGKHLNSPIQCGSKMITPLSRNRLNEVLQDKQCKTPLMTTANVTNATCTTIYNPFEKCSAEILQLPAVSPHLFKEVVSPSEKEDESFAWSIDQVALLNPTNIDTSPWNQIDLPSDPDYERRAQEAIDRFFSSKVVPSPWTGSSHSSNLLSALLSSGASASGSKLKKTPAEALHSPFMASSNYQDLYRIKNDEVLNSSAPINKGTLNSVWCQTELTFPPVIPKEIQDLLVSYSTFTQDQTSQFTEEADDAVNLNNTTLRRKLLFNNEELSNATPLCSPKEKSKIQDCSHNANSPVSTPPLPNDDDEPFCPWGISMICPSSRMSENSSQAPHYSSSSFIRYSFGSSEDEKDLIKEPISPISIRSISPIQSFNSPKFGSQQNSPKFSSQQNSPKFSSQQNSPKFSSHEKPQTSFSKSIHTFEPHMVSVEQQQSPRQNLFTQINSDKKNTSPTSHILDDLSNSGILLVKKVEKQHSGHSSQLEDSALGLSCSKFEEHKKKKQKTPKDIKMSLCPRAKCSPQFSSSPIKENLSSGNDGLTNRPNEDGHSASVSSQRFSESPPLSPISWRMDENFEITSLDDHHGNTKTSLLQHNKYLYNSNEGENGKEILQRDQPVYKAHKLKGLSDMDIDSHPFLEGSTLDEAYSGQDTGYQTCMSGIPGDDFSLQTTNTQMS